MKTRYFPIACMLLSLTGVAQERNLALGGAAGVNLTGAWGTGPYGLKANTLAGWNAHALVSGQVTNRLLLMGQLGVVAENNETELTIFPTFKWSYLWAEGSGILAYRPIVKSEYGVFTGVGFSSRLLVNATMRSEVWESNGVRRPIENDVSNDMYTWNYSLPVQAGIDFKIASSGKLLLVFEYQLALRDRFKPSDLPGYSGTNAFRRSQLYSFGLKVAYLMPFR